jgi:8-oxo-dGTP pyrophosphatase MutT (NUDIX family)
VTPTERIAARVLVIDPDGHVLLFRGFDPGRPELGSYWFTPGGGLDDGESFEDAARRELREETGLVVDDVGPPLFEQRIEFRFEDDHFAQTEHFFCVRTERFVIDDTEWTDIEQRSVVGHRWWSAAELAAATERVYPEDLADRIARITAG